MQRFQHFFPLKIKASSWQHFWLSDYQNIIQSYPNRNWIWIKFTLFGLILSNCFCQFTKVGVLGKNYSHIYELFVGIWLGFLKEISIKQYSYSI